MLAFDIVIIGMLVWAFFSGLRNGIAVQLCGIAGLLAGVYLALRFGKGFAGWLGIPENVASVSGFIIILIASILILGITGRLIKGMFRLAGLSAVDKIGGAILAVVKVGVVVSMFIYAFDSLNRNTEWIKPEKTGKSKTYSMMLLVAEHSFPFLDMLRETVMTPEENAGAAPLRTAEPRHAEPDPERDAAVAAEPVTVPEADSTDGGTAGTGHDTAAGDDRTQVPEADTTV